ncbi:MAG: MAPEG family protein [Rickettsiales bacterium]
MEDAALTSSHFLTLLGYSVGLLLTHIAIQASLATRELGLTWNTGARDDALKPKGIYAARAERALSNFKETYPAFIGLALALAIAGDNGLGVIGAWLWLGCRLIYIPLYLAGVPYLRTVVWGTSVLGLILMMNSLL